MSRIPELRHLLLFFIDGLGIGADDPEINPCCHPSLNLFRQCHTGIFPRPTASEGLVMGLDANLGMEGLPQSATGQTSLLTGVNGARLLGRHLNAFPTRRCVRSSPNTTSSNASPITASAPLSSTPSGRPFSISIPSGSSIVSRSPP